MTSPFANQKSKAPSQAMKLLLQKSATNNQKNKTKQLLQKQKALLQKSANLINLHQKSKEEKQNNIKNSLAFDRTQLADLSILQQGQDFETGTITSLNQIMKAQSQRKPRQSQVLRLSDFSDDDKNQYNLERRNRIYEHESFKQAEVNGVNLNDNLSTESNNRIFQMVFMKKNALTQSISTKSSSSRRKPEDKNGKLDVEQFNIGKKLGSGKFGQVYAARHIQSGFVCALKKIKKTDIQSATLIQLIRQIKIQSFLNHPNIVKLYNFFCDKENVYLMMEYCASGDMYNYLKKSKRLDTLSVTNLMKQVCKGLEYMHDHTIIHRDLKPENVLLHDGMAKICDFGWSISSTINRQTFCGTPLYVSPQLLKRDNYNNKIDVWSVGILTYQLLIGKVPFDIFSQGDLIKIVQDDIYFSKKYQISDQAKNFILGCLQKDPRDRYTISQLLEHPFLCPQQKLQNKTMTNF